jgi:hypothetical protein
VAPEVCPAAPRRRRGLAVRELLLIVAILTVAFGLMVSLARRVRAMAAFSLVQSELLELEDALAAYHREFGKYPDVPPLVPPTTAAPAGSPSPSPAVSVAAVSGTGTVTMGPEHERLLLENARVQNQALVRVLGIGLEAEERSSTLGGVSAMMFDGTSLMDPWGRPIAYLAAGRPEIGTAAGDLPFFFSAGPDGLYLTRDDNVYSYEVLTAEPEEEDVLD